MVQREDNEQTLGRSRSNERIQLQVLAARVHVLSLSPRGHPTALMPQTISSYLSTLPECGTPPTARLQSIYSDISGQKLSNPTGYQANIAWWRKVLEGIVERGLQPKPDHLVLHADTELVDALRWDRTGKPLALPSVIVRRHFMHLAVHDSLSMHGARELLSDRAQRITGVNSPVQFLGFISIHLCNVIFTNTNCVICSRETTLVGTGTAECRRRKREPRPVRRAVEKGSRRLRCPSSVRGKCPPSRDLTETSHRRGFHRSEGC